MRRLALFATLFAVVAAPLASRPLAAQDTSAVRQQGRGGNRPARDPHRAGPASMWRGAVDSVRERELYVSKDPKDLRGCAPQICDRDLGNKRRTDSVYAAKAPGNYEFQKIKYKSRADGLEIPAYLFSPMNLGNTKHVALVWVHGGVHGDWDTALYPFIVEAVKRGYVILTPDYRGSTGYGDEWMKKIDYGGKEVDDVLKAKEQEILAV